MIKSIIYFTAYKHFPKNIMNQAFNKYNWIISCMSVHQKINKYSYSTQTLTDILNYIKYNKNHTWYLSASSWWHQFKASKFISCIMYLCLILLLILLFFYFFVKYNMHVTLVDLAAAPDVDDNGIDESILLMTNFMYLRFISVIFPISITWESVNKNAQVPKWGS